MGGGVARRRLLSGAVPPRLPQVLVVWHSRTGLARHMADAMEAGAVAAANEMEAPLDVRKLRASEAAAADLLHADGFLFCCPENLASVSGEMLEVSSHCSFPTAVAEPFSAARFKHSHCVFRLSLLASVAVFPPNVLPRLRGVGERWW